MELDPTNTYWNRITDHRGCRSLPNHNLPPFLPQKWLTSWSWIRLATINQSLSLSDLPSLLNNKHTKCSPPPRNLIRPERIGWPSGHTLSAVGQHAISWIQQTSTKPAGGPELPPACRCCFGSRISGACWQIFGRAQHATPKSEPSNATMNRMWFNKNSNASNAPSQPILSKLYLYI